MENVLEVLRVVALLAVTLIFSALIEAVVEAVLGEAMNHVPGGDKWKWLLPYAAYAAGIGGALHYQFDFVYFMGLFLTAILPLDLPAGAPLVTLSLWGIIPSGILIGRGSQFLHKWITKWFKKPGVSDGGGVDLPYAVG